MRLYKLRLLRATKLPSGVNNRLQGGWLGFSAIGRKEKRDVSHLSPELAIPSWLDAKHPVWMARI